MLTPGGVLDSHADDLDRAADEVGAFFDHIRQVGVRGYVAEHLNDADFTYKPEFRSNANEPESSQETTDEG